MPVGSLAAMMLGAAVPETIVALKPRVQVTSRELRVRDLVEIRAGRMPERVAALIVARLPRERLVTEIPAGTMLALLRRRVPGLEFANGRMSTIEITARIAPPLARHGEAIDLPASEIAKGAKLRLRSTAGPVVIERDVTAMQTGRYGARLFVRDAEGKVFTVPLTPAPSKGAE